MEIIDFIYVFIIDLNPVRTVFDKNAICSAFCSKCFFFCFFFLIMKLAHMVDKKKECIKLE